MKLTDWARATPDAAAIVIPGSGEIVTFRQLEERSNQAAHAFRELGLKPGDHIGFMIENRPLFFELAWAATRSGLIYTPISAHLSASDASYILQDCDAKVFITTQKFTAVATDIAKMIPESTRRFIAGGVAEGYASWDDVRASKFVTPIPDETIGIDMSYSSGTTGRPKGVERTPPGNPSNEIDESSRRLAARFNFSNEARFLVSSPLYHGAPMRHSMLVHSLGGTVLVLERFDAEDVLISIEQHRITHALFVPTMFIRLLSLSDATRHRYDLSSLKQVTHLAAPCPIAVKEKMINWWGPIITELYGNTEECGFTSITSPEWLKHKGSIGKPTVGTIHVLDDDGQSLPAGEVGTLWVEGCRPFQYYKDHEKTATTSNQQGWRTVRDNGYVDSEGYVYLTDRAAFTINSGGVKISPKEVEDALCAHQLVADAAVFGVPDSEFGEQVKAVVQLKQFETASASVERELIEHCKTALSKIKAPKSIDFERELPRNAFGKLLKKVLRDRYWPAIEPARAS